MDKKTGASSGAARLNAGKKRRCCAGAAMSIFYAFKSAPCAPGRIELTLGLCARCGLISNMETSGAHEPAAGLLISGKVGKRAVNGAVFMGSAPEFCKDPAQLLKNLRRAVDGRDIPVFFEIRDVLCILRGLSFWEFSQEKSSYFSLRTFSGLLSSAGFRVTAAKKNADGRIFIEAAVRKRGGMADNAAPYETAAAVRFFMENHRQKIEVLRRRLRELSDTGYRAVIWGRACEAAVLVSELGPECRISHAVDTEISNAGARREYDGFVVKPGFLKKFRPDLIISMNPARRDEIKESLEKMDLPAGIVNI